MSASPRGWVSAKLGDLAEYHNGAAFKPADWGTKGMPIIRIQNLTDPSKPLHRTTRIVDDRLRVSDGDILVSWSASLDAFIWNRGKAWLNQHIFRVVPREERVDKRFLFFMLRREIAILLETEHLHGSTMKHINRGPFLSHSVALPPLDEQRRIVAKLDNLFNSSKRARQELAHIPRLAERYKQAVLRAAYNEAEIAATRLTTLDAAAEEVRNGVSRRPENAPPGIPVLKISAVRSMVVRMDERRYYVPEAGEDVSRYALRAGDLLFTRYNGNPELVANCGMVRVLDEQLIFPDKLIRVRLDRQLADPEFVEAVSASPQARTALARSIKSAAGQHGISGADLKRLPIPLPSRDEQQRIIAQIRRSFSAIDGLVAESNHAESLLARLDQATLAKAFRGDLLS